MIKSIAEELSLLLVANKIIKIEKREFYIYGIELMMYNTLITLSIALIAILTNTIILSLIFSVLFCSLRSYSGGYHCTSYLKCFCTSLTIYLSMLVFNAHLGDLRHIVSIVILIASTPIIIIFSPIEHENNPLTKNEKKRYKIVSLIITFFIVLTFISLLIFNLNEFAFVVSWVIFAIAILIIITKIGVKTNEKTMS